MNQKRYWLRWGIATVIIAFILKVLASVILDSQCTSADSLLCTLSKNISLAITVPQDILVRVAYEPNASQLFLFLYQYIIYPIWFMIGALLGLFYGKFKNRNAV
ncbi:MAG: hypothetical protein M3Q73_01050 [bacterium]|nr:hypothetical protein [bacterium]